MTSTAQPSYIPSLDGLRAISIALVFFSHVGLSPLIPGGFGVTIFFFLSGFLITTLLTQEQDAHGWIALQAFYLRRVVRLAPPLLITLAIGVLAVSVGLAQGDLDAGVLFSQVFFFYNYYATFNDGRTGVEGMNILWSLSVEEHFYLIYPSLFIALARGWIGLRSIATLLGAILIWRCIRYYGFGNTEWSIYVSTDTRFDSMLYGCLLALVIWRSDIERWFPARWMWPLLILAIVVLLSTFLVRHPDFRSTIRYTLQGLALMPIFYFAVSRPDSWLFKPLNWAPVRRIGVYSYTLYLVHFAIIKALEFNGLDPTNKPIFIPLAAALSIAYSALIFRYIEQPLKPIRARLTGH